MSALVANVINSWFRKKPPFVNQAELANLLRRDRIDVDKHLRLEEQMQRKPRRGVSPTPRKIINSWINYITWIDGRLNYLEQPRSVADLQEVVREWQDHRKDIVAMTLRWNKRADVIPVD